MEGLGVAVVYMFFCCKNKKKYASTYLFLTTHQLWIVDVLKQYANNHYFLMLCASTRTDKPSPR